MKIKVGDLVTVDALEWIDPVWEFDNPTVVLRPVYREFETAHLDDAIETVMLDLIADGDGEDEPKEYRRWNLRTLKRRFSEAMRGKRFPVANYRVKRQSFAIFRDDDGLMFKEQP